MFFAAEDAFESFGLAYGVAADAAEHQVNQFDDAGGIVSKLEIILCSPDLWHDLAEQDHDETDEDDLDEEFEEPEALFEQDHLVDEEIGEDDDGDIDDAVGDKHGGQQCFWVFEQGDDAAPGGILFGFEDIDILESEGEESHFGP